MTTPMGDLLYELIEFAEMIFGHIVVAGFLGCLCRRLPAGTRGGSWEQRWYVPAVCHFTVMIILYAIPLVLPSFTAYLLGAAAAFLVMIVCGAERYWSLFLAVTFFSLRWQAISVTDRISIEIFDFMVKALNYITEGEFALVWQWNMVHIFINSLLNIVLDVLIFTLLAKWLTAKCSIQNRKLSAREKMFLLTPGFSGSASFFMVKWMIDKYDLVDKRGIFNEYPYFNSMIVCMNFLVILSTLVILSLFADLEKKREEEKRQAVQKRQIQELRDHVQEMERVYSGIQGMKHDVKNHIAVMEELIAQKRFQEAKAYLEPMGRAVETLDYVYKTGNPVTDVIIQEKYKQSRGLGISFNSEFQFPLQSEIDVFDISVILNNALENALEAASKMEGGYIRVSSGWQKRAFLTEVSNSFNGELKWDRESGFPITTKAEGAFHGMGIQNIQRVAEKYCGAVDIEVQEGEFILTVLMSVRNR